MFDKILIANRGEIALRVMHTCKEMGIATVAVHSEIDRQAPHVLYADQAVALGGDEPAESYLNGARIVEAAQQSGAQAIHPGYGFLSENGDFAQLCGDADLVFIGPPPGVLRSVGDKLMARQIAQQAGVAFTPGTLEPSADLATLEKEAQALGFPVMLKAAAGGGGKGMRRVDVAADLAEALQLATGEAVASFGDGRLFVEKCILRPRHIEVQILADHSGKVLHLFERECSIQRRHQKIIEEAPSCAVDDDLRQRMCQAAVAVAQQAGYRNAGTVEFLLDGEGDFYFMEVNARLQVEHPVTEAICGLDLVRLQIEVAAGLPLQLEQAQIKKHGHAVECRIYAEDAASDFMPSPGKIEFLQSPGGPGVRFDAGVTTGSQVPVHYDPILAKLTTWGSSRTVAIDKMARALGETVVLGVKTPLELLLDIVTSTAFRNGELSTAFLQDHFAQWQTQPDRLQTVLLGWLTAELTNLTGAPVLGSAPEKSPGPDPWASIGHWRLEE